VSGAANTAGVAGQSTDAMQNKVITRIAINFLFILPSPLYWENWQILYHMLSVFKIL
jgi:hypothetical protein